MTTADDLADRNASFAEHFSDPLSISPSGNLMVIGCVDPRVDPAIVLGVELGEAGILRNVGGRVTPSTLRDLALLGKVGAANSSTRVPGDWNVIVLHHTDCGMTDLAAFPSMLAEYFEIEESALDGKAVSDPVGSVKVDVELLVSTLHGSDFYVTGIVYDVETGRVSTVVPATPLRST